MSVLYLTEGFGSQKGAASYLAADLTETQYSLELLYTTLSFTHVTGLQAIAQSSEFSVRQVQFNAREGVRTKFASLRLVCLKHISHVFAPQAHLWHEIKYWIIKPRVFPVEDPRDPRFTDRVEEYVFLPQVTVRKPIVQSNQFQVPAILLPPGFRRVKLA